MSGRWDLLKKTVDNAEARGNEKKEVLVKDTGECFIPMTVAITGFAIIEVIAHQFFNVGHVMLGWTLLLIGLIAFVVQVKASWILKMGYFFYGLGLYLVLSTVLSIGAGRLLYEMGY